MSSTRGTATPPPTSCSRATWPQTAATVTTGRLLAHGRTDHFGRAHRQRLLVRRRGCGIRRSNSTTDRALWRAASKLQVGAGHLVIVCGMSVDVAWYTCTAPTSGRPVSTGLWCCGPAGTPRQPRCRPVRLCHVTGCCRNRVVLVRRPVRDRTVRRADAICRVHLDEMGYRGRHRSGRVRSIQRVQHSGRRGRSPPGRVRIASGLVGDHHPSAQAGHARDRRAVHRKQGAAERPLHLRVRQP